MTMAALKIPPDHGDYSDDTETDRDPDSGNSTVIESHIMRRIRDGDISAFETLYKTFFVQLWEFSCRYVHDSDVAQDIVQDVLVALWQKRESLSGDENIPPYLYAAVRYRSLDAVRRVKTAKRAREVLTQNLPDQQHTSNDADLMEAELNSAVERVLARLSETPRRVLMLRWKHGLTYAEIATSLGISEGAAKVHATRARQVLAPYLSALISPE